MDSRAKLRYLSLLQVVTGILYVLSGMFSISSVVACSREEAVSRGLEVPTDFPRVLILHRVAYHWPFGKGLQILAFSVCLATLAFLFGSAWYARRLKDRH